MKSRLIQLADAVVNALNTEALPGEFKAERRFAPFMDLREGDQTIHVTVVPRGVKMAMAEGTRGAVKNDFVVDIAVQKKLTSPESDEIAGLLFLEERICDLFQNACFTEAEWAEPVDCQNAPVYSWEHLKQSSMFTGVITLTYRGYIKREQK